MQDRSSIVSWILAIALHVFLIVWVGFNFEPKTLHVKQEKLVAKTIILDQEVIAMTPPPPQVIEDVQLEPEPEILPLPEPEPIPEPEPEPIVAADPTPPPEEKPEPVKETPPPPKPEPVKETPPPPKPEPKKKPVEKPKPKPAEKPKPKPKKQEQKPKPKEKPKPKSEEKPKPKKETPKPPAPKKEAPKPAPKKEEPAKPQVSEKQKALMAKAKQSLTNIESADVKKAPASAVKPTKLGALNIESGGSPSYQRALASKLRSLLTLPEFGDVKLKLTLSRAGKVLKIEIISAKSKRNQTYVEQTLRSATMPVFGEHFTGSEQETFTLTLTSE